MSKDRFPLYQALWRSFYCPKLYEHAAKHWRGRGFLYLLLVVTIAVLPTMLFLKMALGDFMELEGQNLLEQWPTVVIENGQASVEVEEPYTIMDSEGEPYMMIDTTGKLHTPEEAGVLILMTKRQLIMSGGGSGTRTFDLGDMEDMRINADVLAELWARMEKFFLPVATPALILFWFGFRSLQALFYALVGMAMLRVLEVKLPYAALVQIAILALTPALAVQLLLNLLNIHLPIEGLAVFVIAMIYLWFGIRAATAGQLPPKQRA